jgi:hypothetical protein
LEFPQFGYDVLSMSFPLLRGLHVFLLANHFFSSLQPASLTRSSSASATKRCTPAPPAACASGPGTAAPPPKPAREKDKGDSHTRRICQLPGYTNNLGFSAREKGDGHTRRICQLPGYTNNLGFSAVLRRSGRSRFYGGQGARRPVATGVGCTMRFCGPGFSFIPSLAPFLYGWEAGPVILALTAYGWPGGSFGPIPSPHEKRPVRGGVHPVLPSDSHNTATYFGGTGVSWLWLLPSGFWLSTLSLIGLDAEQPWDFFGRFGCGV